MAPPGEPVIHFERDLMSDPAESSAYMRLFYLSWRPLGYGHLVNRLQCWYSGLGLPTAFQVALEVAGRRSGRTRANPVGVATVSGKQYLVAAGLSHGSDYLHE